MGKPYKQWSNDEDNTLIKFAGVKTASEISVILSRPKNGIHHRAKKLGVSLIKKGENHWNSKLSNLQVQMLLVLHDSGFSVNEIQKAAFNHVSVLTISDVVAARTRKEQ